MKNTKNMPVKRMNSMHTQIHCKSKMEINTNNNNNNKTDSKKSFDYESHKPKIELNTNNNSKTDFKKSFNLENNKPKNDHIKVQKRNSFQCNKKIFLKAINKKNCDNLKETTNLGLTSIKNKKKFSKSGKNNKFRNPNFNLKIKNKNDKKILHINCLDGKPKSLSKKDLPVDLQIDSNEDKKEDGKDNNLECGYKEDKIEIVYNSTINNIYLSATQKGYSIKNQTEKENNQDVSLIIEDVCGIKNYNIYGIMDGHGSNGHQVSKYIKDKIIQNFNNISFYFSKIANTSNNQEYPENILELIKNKLTKNNFKKIKDFYISLDEGLTAKEILFDSNFSGSTCILLFQIGNYLISSNVGDSRAIMIKENNEIIELSLDQKPENENEKKRILKMGGVISQCNDLYDDGKEGGPFRIWVKGCDYPGIAMSRSIGDKIAHDIGVISEPEILDFNLDDKCKYLIMGSDGLWQYLKNENVVEIISPFLEEKNVEKAAKEIIKKSTLSWIENDSNVDDITVSIIFLKM